MPGSFWALLVVFLLTWIISTILAFLIDGVYGTVTLVGYIVLYALFMWNQACLETGACKELAWLMVVLWTVAGGLTIAAMGWALTAKRQLKKAAEHASVRYHDRDRERDRDHDKKEGFYWGGMSPALQ